MEGAYIVSLTLSTSLILGIIATILVLFIIMPEKGSVKKVAEVNSIAEGTFEYSGSNLSDEFYVENASFFAQKNITWDSASTQLRLAEYGSSITNQNFWSYAPECIQAIYRFVFTTPMLDDDGQETSDYKVMLTRRCRNPFRYNIDYIYNLQIFEKTPTHFDVNIDIQTNPAFNDIKGHSFDFVVF